MAIAKKVSLCLQTFLNRTLKKRIKISDLQHIKKQFKLFQKKRFEKRDL